MLKTDDYRVKPGSRVNLKKWATRYEGDLEREKAEQRFVALRTPLNDLQERLYSEGRRSLLVVFQAMDAGGKDSTVRKVFGPVNPAGCRVTSFKAPSALERAHDFLWRVHAAAPRAGNIGVFNRSHYEDVLIARVKNLVPEKVWKKRYDHINDFERLLTDEGTAVVKFFLHITKGYQKQRLQRRLDRPDKHWKFNPEDLTERARWHEYQKAFEVALSRSSTKACPWYIVPAERRWFRNLLVRQVIVEKLRAMNPKHPDVTFDASKIVIE